MKQLSVKSNDAIRIQFVDKEIIYERWYQAYAKLHERRNLVAQSI